MRNSQPLPSLLPCPLAAGVLEPRPPKPPEQSAPAEEGGSLSSPRRMTAPSEHLRHASSVHDSSQNNLWTVLLDILGMLDRLGMMSQTDLRWKV